MALDGARPRRSSRRLGAVGGSGRLPRRCGPRRGRDPGRTGPSRRSPERWVHQDVEGGLATGPRRSGWRRTPGDELGAGDSASSGSVCPSVLARACRGVSRSSDPSINWSSRSAPRPSPVRARCWWSCGRPGVNFVDGLMCQGRYQMKPAVPYVPGGELAGVVSGRGRRREPHRRGRPGHGHERVRRLRRAGGGSADSVEGIPADLGFGQAAAFIQSYSTAWFTLTRRASVQEGEWVLVLGAGGGIGLASVDVAVALGARVIAAASSTEKSPPPGPWGPRPPSPTRTKT